MFNHVLPKKKKKKDVFLPLTSCNDVNVFLLSTCGNNVNDKNMMDDDGTMEATYMKEM